MTNATFTQPSQRFPVTQLRLGRIVTLGVVVLATVLGGAFWLLTTQARPGSRRDAIVESTAWPAWLKQAQAYPTAEPKSPPAPVTPPVDQTAAQLAALRASLEEQRLAIEELRRRGMVKPTPPADAKAAPPAKKAPTPMLYVSHEIKETAALAKEPTYTVMPGYFIPCQIETSMNSDTGDVTFVATTTSTVYDTETGRHALIPQSSKIVGEAQGSTLLYGNELMRTVSLTLSRRQDKEPIELGKAPVTDQKGVNGLASRVDSHFWRLVGAVFIGGALRGGTQALTTAVASSGPMGAVGGGIAQSGQQAITQRTGPALNTRPTIEVDAGQLCNVIVLKPLHLTEAR